MDNEREGRDSRAPRGTIHRRVKAPTMQAFRVVAARRDRTWPGDAGVSLVEVLVASLVIGVSVIALSLMFANGSAWVSAMGEDRVAAGLAQQRIEQVRAGLVANWEYAPPAEAEVDPAGCNPSSNAQCAQTVKYRRTTCVQYVDPSSADGLNVPPYTADCPAGNQTSVKRITVTVAPVFVPAGAGEQAVPRASVMTLQGWVSQAGR